MISEAQKRFLVSTPLAFAACLSFRTLTVKSKPAPTPPSSHDQHEDLRTPDVCNQIRDGCSLPGASFNIHVFCRFSAATRMKRNTIKSSNPICRDPPSASTFSWIVRGYDIIRYKREHDQTRNLICRGPPSASTFSKIFAATMKKKKKHDEKEYIF